MSSTIEMPVEREFASSGAAGAVARTAKDPVCGMVVDRRAALSSTVAGRTYYFCSPGCQRTFEAPEAELLSLKRRVTIAMTGVLVLAVLRAAVFLGLAAGATVLTWVPIGFLPWSMWGRGVVILVTPVQFIGGATFYKGAWQAVRRRTVNMDFLVAMGTSVAYAYSVIVVFAPDLLPIEAGKRGVYFEVSAVIIAFVLLGRYMEDIIKKKSSAAVRKLMDLRPATAHVVREGVEMEVPAESVAVDEVVVVRPGEMVPTDGVVIEGASAVDEKLITGESMPVEKRAGNEVIGGTLNKTGAFSLRTTRVGADTTLNQIIHLVEDAQSTSSQIQRIADRVTVYFVPAVVAIALASFVFWVAVGNLPTAVLSFIAVLIIACPCALGIATPAALMVGVGKGAEGGILIRGAEYLERALKLTTVVFDKTGTLTRGEPAVTDVVSEASWPADELIRVAGALERRSEHPLAQAIVAHAAMGSLQVPAVEEFSAVSGEGVRGRVEGRPILVGNRRHMASNGVDIPPGAEEQLVALEGHGKTAMLVAADGDFAGIIAVADTLKPHSAEAVRDLKALDVKVLMLTGDNERTARAIADELGLTDVIAGVLPADKASKIQELRDAGEIVAMVGDGINDAPALATAEVGIALGSGSDVAKETGGIILMHDDPRDVVTSIRLSRATMRKIHQNLFWAFGYNAAAVPLAAVGLLNPIIAAAAMALSSLSVITNSAFLKRLQLEDPAAADVVATRRRATGGAPRPAPNAS